MLEDVLIGPGEASRLSEAGKAVLVCAYRDERRCQRIRLQGALTFGEFLRRRSSMSKDMAVVFY